MSYVTNLMHYVDMASTADEVRIAEPREYVGLQFKQVALTIPPIFPDSNRQTFTALGEISEGKLRKGEQDRESATSRLRPLPSAILEHGIPGCSINWMVIASLGKTINIAVQCAGGERFQILDDDEQKPGP